MKLYKEVELPKFSFLSEAIYWIALGRAPEAFDVFPQLDERCAEGEDTVQIQDDGELIWFDDECLAIDKFFYESEFVALGEEIDYDKYLDIHLSTNGMTKEEFLLDSSDTIESVQNSIAAEGTDEYFKQYCESRLADIFQAAEAADWVASLDSLFDQLFDMAESQLFLALANGKIAALGFEVVNPIDPEEVYPPSMEKTAIPSGNWNLVGVDWYKNKLAKSKSLFLGCQIETEQLLAQWSQPLMAHRKVEATLHGVHLALPNAFPSFPLPRSQNSRGRPQTRTPTVEKLLLGEFERRRMCGELPAKIEAIIQEAIDWYKCVAGKELKRTTVQRYLKPVTEKMPKNTAQ